MRYPLLLSTATGWRHACVVRQTDECEPKGLLELSPLCRGGNFSGASYIEKSEHESGRNADGEGRGKSRPFGCTGEVARTCFAHATSYFSTLANKGDGCGFGGKVAWVRVIACDPP